LQSSAETNVKNNQKGGEPPFDQIWCVFDHEGCNKHPSLDEAIDKAKAHKLKVALSVPCFEFWYLLHIQLTTRPYTKCTEVIRDLKQIGDFHQYSKGAGIPIELLIREIETANINAVRVREHLDQMNSFCPRSDTDLLVKQLQIQKPI